MKTTMVLHQLKKFVYFKSVVGFDWYNYTVNY